MSFTYPKNFLPFHTLYHHNIIDEDDRLWQEINPIAVSVGDINELYRELESLDGKIGDTAEECRDKLRHAIERRTYKVEYMIEMFMHISFLYNYHLEGE